MHGSLFLVEELLCTVPLILNLHCNNSDDEPWLGKLLDYCCTGHHAAAHLMTETGQLMVHPPQGGGIMQLAATADPARYIDT